MTRSPTRRNAALAGAGALFLGFGLSVSSLAFGQTPDAGSNAAINPEDDYGADIQGTVPGASAIEGRLMAPCCWTQTIDIHDSPIALSMRHEIRRRLRNGESPEVIQQSMVDRYGPKILAVQEGSQLKNVFIGLSVVMGGAGVAAAMMIGRWRKHSPSTTNPKPGDGKAPERDEWDDKLDAELKKLDDE